MNEPSAVTPSIPARLKLLLEDPGICTAMYYMFGDGRIGPALSLLARTTALRRAESATTKDTKLHASVYA